MRNSNGNSQKLLIHRDSVLLFASPQFVALLIVFSFSSKYSKLTKHVTTSFATSFLKFIFRVTEIQFSTNSLKVDARDSPGVLHNFRRLGRSENNFEQKYRGRKRSECQLCPCRYRAVLKLISSPRCCAATTIAVWTKTTFSALTFEMVIGCMLTGIIEREIAREQKCHSGTQANL